MQKIKTQSLQHVSALKDPSFKVFQKYYNHYPLSELTYSIRRRLFEPARVQFDDVIKELEYISAVFNDRIINKLDDFFPFCLSPDLIEIFSYLKNNPDVELFFKPFAIKKMIK